MSNRSNDTVPMATDVQEAVEVIRQREARAPEVALVLGSGLGLICRVCVSWGRRGRRVSRLFPRPFGGDLQASLKDRPLLLPWGFFQLNN